MDRNSENTLTARQQREIEYHRVHAAEHAFLFEQPFSWDVLDNPSRRWWNAYWQMYSYLAGLDLRGKRVLVIGCGFGEDALRLAKLGAEVYAFDLSTESLNLARRLAGREGLTIHFEEMPAEMLRYDSNFFDCVVARDILHHVDIPRATSEICRVSKPGAIFVVNEVYSHSLADRIRHSALVVKVLYPRMQRLIYGARKPYITEDERKLNEVDVEEITRQLRCLYLSKYFAFLVNRVVPDKFEMFSQIDRALLIVLKPLGRFLGGRVLLSGPISK